MEVRLLESCAVPSLCALAWHHSIPAHFLRDDTSSTNGKTPFVTGPRNLNIKPPTSSTLCDTLPTLCLASSVFGVVYIVSCVVCEFHLLLKLWVSHGQARVKLAHGIETRHTYCQVAPAVTNPLLTSLVIF